MENHMLAGGTFYLMGEWGRSSAQNWQMMQLGVIDPITDRKGVRDLSALHFISWPVCFWNWSVLAVLRDGLCSAPPKTNTSRDITQVLCLRTNVVFKDKSGLILHSNTCV